MTPTRTNWQSDLTLLLAVVIWGLNFPILKAALAYIHPHVINVFRFAISTGVLGLIYAYHRRNDVSGFWTPVRTHRWRIVGLGLLGTVAYQLFFIIGVDRTAAGTAALIMASAPMWTAILGALLRTEYLRRLAWLGLLVSLIGTSIVVAGGASEIGFAPGTLFGNIMMLGAALTWGSYTAFNRPVLMTIKPITLSFFSLLVGLPVLTLIGIPFFRVVDWSEIPWWVWLAILYSGGLSTGVAIALWNSAIRAVGASHTAAYNNLVPFTALLASYLILGEAVTAIQVVGGVMIIGGLVMMRRTRQAALPRS